MRRSPGLRTALAGAAAVLASCGGHGGAGSAQVHSGAPATPASPRDRAAVARAGADWPTFDYDAARSGVGPADTGITAANVSRLRTQVVRLDGTVDASAIELHAVRVAGRGRDVLFVTTSYGRTIALDARTGHRLWQYTPPTISAYEGSYQVTTTTPVADPDRAHIYTASPDGVIRKLLVANGREVRSGHWPASVTLLATREKIASALNLSGRYVIVTTGGYLGDAPPYQGKVVTIDRATGAIAHVWNSLCSDRHAVIAPSSCPASDSAIWAREGAVVEPGSGRLLVATGNGPFNGSTDWGDSVLELTPDAARLLQNWTPGNQAQLGDSDTDLGSTAPAVLPPYGGRRLAVMGGKDGILRLLDLARLNGTTGGASGRTGGELQRLPSPGGTDVFSAPAVWTHGGRTYVFVADSAGTAAYVLQGSPAHPALRVAWQVGTAGTSPVLAGGLLYVYDEFDGYLAVRVPATGHTLARLPAAAGHWNSPIVAGGRIVLPTGNYQDHASTGALYIYRAPGA